MPRKQIMTVEEAAALFAEIKASAAPICLTEETEGTLPELAFAGLSLLFDGKVYHFPHESGAWQEVFKYLADASMKKILCEGKEFFKTCLAQGVRLAGIEDDCALALIWPNPARAATRSKPLADRIS
jgi:hypothetical protein